MYYQILRAQIKRNVWQSERRTESLWRWKGSISKMKANMLEVTFLPVFLGLSYVLEQVLLSYRVPRQN